MDLNQLLADHQRALLRARRAQCAEDREAQLVLAQHYQACISAFRDERGLPHYTWQNHPQMWDDTDAAEHPRAQMPTPPAR